MMNMKPRRFASFILFIIPLVMPSSSTPINETSSPSYEEWDEIIRRSESMLKDMWDEQTRNEELNKPELNADSVEVLEDIDLCYFPEESALKDISGKSSIRCARQVGDSWEQYKSTYSKMYLDQKREADARKAWLDNHSLVEQHNQLFVTGNLTYALHVNNLGDLSLHDYLKKMAKLVNTRVFHDPSKEIREEAMAHLHSVAVPDTFDWRHNGFKPRMEEQFRCGACYAFSIAHALQAQLYKKHRNWHELSVQQIVDCSGVDGNYGCGGGSLSATLRYASRAGLELEQDYPYKAKRGSCIFNPLKVAAKVLRWGILPAGDESALQRAIALIGPVAIAINAAPRSFQLYRSGSYDDPICTSNHLNHAMLVVGYTKDSWIVLNWWGALWGEHGYMRIKRGKNRCGVANNAVYVQIV